MKQVVLRHARHVPFLRLVPCQVGNLASMASVNKQKLWWAIFCFLGRLFLSNARKIPQGNATVSTSSAQYSFAEWSPLALKDFIVVVIHRMQPLADVAKIPKCATLVLSSSCQQELVEWIHANAVHWSFSSLHRLSGSRRLPKVPAARTRFKGKRKKWNGAQSWRMKHKRRIVASIATIQ